MRKATIKKFYKGFESYSNLLALNADGNPKFLSCSDRDFITRQFSKKNDYLLQLRNYLSDFLKADKFEPLFFYSATAFLKGIDNYPYEPYIKYNIMLSSKLMCSLIEQFVNYYNECHVLKITGDQITNTSAYRCKKLNSLLGGSPTSLHLSGLAYDLFFLTSSERNCFAHFIKDVVVDEILEQHSNSNYPVLAPFELIVYENTNRVHIGFKYFLFNK